MCGFAAFFEHNRHFSSEILAHIDKDLYHRGPDSGGRFQIQGAAMVFRRLAIISPDAASNQPFHDISGRYVMTFNGEIYNYKHLRKQLLEKSITLRTESDTEVIIEGFSLWGEKIFEKLEGMFAIVIYDKVTQCITLARDGLGIKPLYISRQGGFLGVASEMKPLRRMIEKTEIDPVALAELLYFRYAAGRLSNLKHIEMFPSGTVAQFSLTDFTYKERCFQNLLDTFHSDHRIDRPKALEIIESALLDSTKAHMQSDVGYSLQLSGGVDSSLVLGLTTLLEGQSLESYSVQLEDPKHDESSYRKAVIDTYKPQHKERLFTEYDFADAFPKAVFHMEGPLAHMSCVMLMLLCQDIKEKHKVVLTGEGADELFGGYSRYAIWKKLSHHEMFGKKIPNFLWPVLKKYETIKQYQNFDGAAISAAFIDHQAIKDFFPDLQYQNGARETASAQFKHFVDRLFAVDQTSYLGSLLLRQDKMAMAMSVEARVPFAHFPLFEAVNKIPRQIKVVKGETKPLLKHIAKKWLPAHVVDRRKIGLTLPYHDWLKNPKSFGRYLDLLTDNHCCLAQFGDGKKLKSTAENFRAGRSCHRASVLPHLVNTEIWLRSLDHLDYQSS